MRIDAAGHAFLRRDSYIACHEVLRLPTNSVIAELAADLSRIRGRLHEEVLIEVVAAVKRAPTLSPAEQTRIADALTRQAAGGGREKPGYDPLFSPFIHAEFGLRWKSYSDPDSLLHRARPLWLFVRHGSGHRSGSGRSGMRCDKARRWNGGLFKLLGFLGFTIASL